MMRGRLASATGTHAAGMAHLVVEDSISHDERKKKNVFRSMVGMATTARRVSVSPSC